MGQKFSEVEAVFHEEVNSKKKGFKEFKNATKSRRLGKSSVMLASDYMSRSEKMKHRRAGTIMTTNMYDTILTFMEFDQLEKHEKRNRLQYWRSNYSNKEIQEAMGISNKKYYDFVDELDLPKAPRTPRGEKKEVRKATVKKEAPKSIVREQEPPSAPEVKEEQKNVQEVIVNGLNVIFNGTYSAEKIEKQLTKFMLLLDGEEEDFYIELRLMQKQPKT